MTAAAIFALPGRSAQLVTVRGKVLVDNGQAVARDSTLAARVSCIGAALTGWAAAHS